MGFRTTPSFPEPPRVMRLMTAFVDKSARLVDTEHRLAVTSIELEAVRASTSWKVTRPLRAASRTAGRLRRLLGRSSE